MKNLAPDFVKHGEAQL